MPNLTSDQSVQAVVWRNYTKNGATPISQFQANNLKVGNDAHFKDIHTHLVLPTVIGLRNGVPYGQEQTDPLRQYLEINPYPTAKSPFHSHNVEDIAPRHYQVNPLGGTAGELTNLSSMGGNPLSFAMADMNQVDDQIYKERMRMDSRNPLSAGFAKQAIEASKETVEGYKQSILGKKKYDENEERMKLHGKIGDHYTSVEKHNEMVEREIKKAYDTSRTVTAQDVLSFKDLFKNNLLPKQNNMAVHTQTGDDEISSLNVDHGGGSGGGGGGWGRREGEGSASEDDNDDGGDFHDAANDMDITSIHRGNPLDDNYHHGGGIFGGFFHAAGGIVNDFLNPGGEPAGIIARTGHIDQVPQRPIQIPQHPNPIDNEAIAAISAIEKKKISDRQEKRANQLSITGKLSAITQQSLDGPARNTRSKKRRGSLLGDI